MAIDGIIILDNTGRPVIQTDFRAHSPAYPLLHIDAFNDACARAPRGRPDPVLPVAGHRGPAACCHVEAGGLRLLAPVSCDVDPLFVFAFLQTFVDTLQDYLGEISAATLREHFDVVYQLLEEMLDNGHPLTTERNALRDIVLPPSLLNKILAVAGAPGLAKVSATPFASPIPWRRAGVRYNSNEIYFDVVESLKAIVNKAGTVLSSNAWGKIEADAHLSGTPDLLLTFGNAHVLQDCAFHPCVRLQRWTRDKALSFVPPDGRFALMEYRYAPAVPGAAGARPLAVPFQLNASVTLTEHGGTLDLTLTSRLSTRLIEQLAVELFLGEDASGANCTVSSGASWGFDPKTLMLRWEVAKVPQGSSHTLRGTFSSGALRPRPSRAFQITFGVPGYSYSSVKVDQLKLKGETYKPYKGVRMRSTGDVEWRW